MPLPPPSRDSTVVVTGASSGIGSELARELARRNHNVTLVARRGDRLEVLKAELEAGNDIRADVRVCDLTDPAARTELVEGLGEVGGLCNNAGYGDHGPFHSADLAWNLDMIRLNCEALVHLTGAVLPGMVDRGIGSILNVASLAAFQPLPNWATYAATKAFVQSFSEAVHSELAGTGVSVTVLCPGPVRTEFGRTAGIGGLEDGVPDVAYVDAGKVARAAIRAMASGRRSVIPSVKWKATGAAGRYVPRSVLLPLAKRVP
jgi:short-subunit dehydrogenase